jgi:hypothetical protein
VDRGTDVNAIGDLPAHSVAREQSTQVRSMSSP